MSRLALALAVLALSLSGCPVYGGDYGYPGPSVRYYESYPSYRVYYDDDRNYHRWHRDRYQERRHSHYAPGYDGRYQWQDGRRHERYREHDRGYQPPRHGWDQRYRQHDRRDQSSWQRHGGQRYDGYPRKHQERRHERHRSQEREPDRRSQRGDGRYWGISN